MWPGWATAAATVTTFAFGGGDPNVIAIGVLLAIGVALTASPVVYQTVERLEFFKVGAVLVFLVVALVAGDQRHRVRATSPTASRASGTFPSEISTRDPASARSRPRARAARTTSCRATGSATRASGWARYVPRIVSPITGQEEAAPVGPAPRSFPHDERNLGRWRLWWKRANIEQFVSFA